MLKQRDDHLSKLLGMKTEGSESEAPQEASQELQTSTEPTSSALSVAADSFADEVTEEIGKMEELSTMAVEVLNNAKDMLQDLPRGQEVEAFATLLKNTTELRKTILDAKEKRHGYKDGGGTPGIGVQNNLIITDPRELNKLLRGAVKDAVVVTE